MCASSCCDTCCPVVFGVIYALAGQCMIGVGVFAILTIPPVYQSGSIVAAGALISVSGMATVSHGLGKQYTTQKYVTLLGLSLFIMVLSTAMLLIVEWLEFGILITDEISEELEKSGQRGIYSIVFIISIVSVVSAISSSLTGIIYMVCVFLVPHRARSNSRSREKDTNNNPDQQTAVNISPDRQQQQQQQLHSELRPSSTATSNTVRYLIPRPTPVRSSPTPRYATTTFQIDRGSQATIQTTGTDLDGRPVIIIQPVPMQQQRPIYIRNGRSHDSAVGTSVLSASAPNVSTSN